MQDDFLEHILKVCEILKTHKIEYMMVGGTALAFHGYYHRTTLPNGLPSDKHDFDFW
jgi:hypothetical protein